MPSEQHQNRYRMRAAFFIANRKMIYLLLDNYSGKITLEETNQLKFI